MSIRSFSLNVGQHYFNVVDAPAGAIVNNVQVLVDESVALTREQFLITLQEITQYCVTTLYPNP